MTPLSRYQFQRIDFDSERQILRDLCQPDLEFPLRPQLSTLLKVLIEARGTVLTKEDLFTAVWGDAVVSEDALFRAIRDLRKALDDLRPGVVFIKTIPKRGYEWVADDCPQQPIDNPSPVERNPPPRVEVQIPRRTRRKLWTPIILSVAGITLAVFILARSVNAPVAVTEQPPLRVAVMPITNRSDDTDHAWVRLGLADVIIRMISEDERLMAVPLEHVVQSDSENSTPDRLFNETGCSHVLISALDHQDELWRVDFEIRSPTHAIRVGHRSISSPMEAAQFVVGELRGALVQGKTRRDAPEDTFSPNDYVNETYAKGVEILTKEGPGPALPYFEICVNQDPEFIWGWIRQAKCIFLGGDVELAISRLETRIGGPQLEQHEMARAYVHVQLAEMNIDLEDVDEAERHIDLAMTSYRAQGHQYGIIDCLVNKGIIAHHRGRDQKAAEHYHEAIDIARSINDRHSLARLYNNLALFKLEDGQLQDARREMERALEMAATFGSRDTEATILGNLAIVDTELRHYDQAIARFNQLAQIHRATGNQVELAWVQLSLAFAHYYDAQFESAERLMDEAARMLRQVQNQRLELAAVSALVYFRLYRGALNQCVAPLERAAELRLGLADPHDDAAIFYWSVAAWYQVEQGDMPAARHAFAQIPTDVANRDNVALLVAARIAYEERDFEAATELMRKAKEATPGSWHSGLQAWLSIMESNTDHTYRPLPSLITGQVENRSNGPQTP